jgi:hypothetical protein
MPAARAPILVMKPGPPGEWRAATANDKRRLVAIMRRRELDIVRMPLSRSVAALVAICEHMGVEVVFRPGACPAPVRGAARGRRTPQNR